MINSFAGQWREEIIKDYVGKIVEISNRNIRKIRTLKGS